MACRRLRVFTYLIGFLAFQTLAITYFKWENERDVNVENYVTTNIGIQSHFTTRLNNDITTTTVLFNQDDLGAPTTAASVSELLLPSANTSGYACTQPSASTMVILVHSAVKNQRVRDAIRNSWARSDNLEKYGASLYFFIAKSKTANATQIAQELQQHSDLIQLDFIDSYRNLSRKSVESFRWASRHCPNVQYILKQDDDTYVNLTRLLVKLDDFQRDGKDKFIAGYYFPNRQPQRNPKSQYYTPLSLWPHKHWPAAVTGPAYVITSNVIRQILRRADDPTTPFVLWEDMYITAMIRNYENIPIYDIKGMRHTVCRSTSNATKALTAVSFHRVDAVSHQNLYEGKPCFKRKSKSSQHKVAQNNTQLLQPKDIKHQRHYLV